MISPPALFNNYPSSKNSSAITFGSMNNNYTSSDSNLSPLVYFEANMNPPPILNMYNNSSRYNGFSPLYSSNLQN